MSVSIVFGCLTPLSLFLVSPVWGTAVEQLPGGDQITQHEVNQERTPAYTLGPGDVLEIRAVEMDEIATKAIHVGADGTLNLPLIGTVLVSGLTCEELVETLTKRLSVYVKSPQVSANLIEMRSRPVSVVGAVRNPGVYQIENQKTIVQMIGLAGGLREDAGDVARLARRTNRGALPPNLGAVTASDDFNTVDFSLSALMDAKIPAATLPVAPDDVISIGRAETVFIMGEVRKPGGFVLAGGRSISILEALSRAEGVTRTAALNKARILRFTGSGSDRNEVPIDLARILNGKNKDIRLNANDILFIPNSNLKATLIRSTDALIQIGTGVAIYRP